jgi:hypothetical protein
MYVRMRSAMYESAYVLLLLYTMLLCAIAWALLNTGAYAKSGR